MNLSVLRISDLHRDPESPIRNDVLLDSLQNDRCHYTAEETPAVRSPDLVIVSGDIIHGIRPDEPDPDKKLREQYQEALDFPSRLTDRFVNGSPAALTFTSAPIRSRTCCETQRQRGRMQRPVGRSVSDIAALAVVEF